MSCCGVSFEAFTFDLAVLTGMIALGCDLDVMSGSATDSAHRGVAEMTTRLWPAQAGQESFQMQLPAVASNDGEVCAAAVHRECAVRFVGVGSYTGRLSIGRRAVARPPCHRCPCRLPGGRSRRHHRVFPCGTALAGGPGHVDHECRVIARGHVVDRVGAGELGA